ncbi:MAG: DUF427 domain-containing protein [Caulobacteraceae bacterium]
MKIPGPDHPITIAANPKRVRARIEGHVIADTAAALTLQEASYPPVQYIPREDAEMGFLARTEKHTTCPYKGEASYYSIMIEGRLLENVVWSYEDPYPAMQAIRRHLAFYPQVDVYELSDDAVNG